MIKQFVEKLRSAVKNRKAEQNNSDIGFRFWMKIKSISIQFPLLADSNFFTAYLTIIHAQPNIDSFYHQKLSKIHEKSKENQAHEMQLASIILNITQRETGIFFPFIKLWVSFCQFQIKKNIEGTGDRQKRQFIQKFIHKQFFLLCYFIYQLCLWIYQKPFSRLKQIAFRNLFKLIRDTVTSIRQFEGIQSIILEQIKPSSKIDLSNEQIEQNKKQLNKICQLSNIPAHFIDSQNILKKFIMQQDIELKLKQANRLIDKVKEQMNLYREINNMKSGYIYCADDVLSALTYLAWRTGRNLYGACFYIETILTAEFKEAKYKELADELDRFGQQTRHSFQTVKSVSHISLISESKIYI